MAPRATITTPELEAGIAFEESPLRESLSPFHTTTPLSLPRKRSAWFNSAREALNRSATQARSYVDSLRGGSSPIASEEEFDIDMRSNDAATTLRQQLQFGAPKGRQRRGALADVCESHNVLSEIENGASPGSRGHSKRLSGVVGSIRRGLRRDAPRSPPKLEFESEVEVQVEQIAANVPALTLDFGAEVGLGISGAEVGILKTEEAPETFNQANDGERTDFEEVFERSVDREIPLKRMVSLDAMAEKYVRKASQEPKHCELPEIRRTISSATTILDCPSDMEELSRQPERMETPKALPEDQTESIALRTPPTIEIHGPEIELPFRPKHDALEDLSNFDGHILRECAEGVVPAVFEEPACKIGDVQEHWVMVSAVLDIVDRDSEDVGSGLSEVLMPETLAGEAAEDSNAIEPSESGSNVEIEEEISSMEAVHSSRPTTPTDSEERVCPESLKKAIEDNYELQVAMGGVDITCDDLFWEKLAVKEDNENAKPEKKIPEYVAVFDDSGSDGGCVERGELTESLDEALDLFRAYRAVEDDDAAVEELLDALESPKIMECVIKRKAMPERLKLRGGKQG